MAKPLNSGSEWSYQTLQKINPTDTIPIDTTESAQQDTIRLFSDAQQLIGDTLEYGELQPNTPPAQRSANAAKPSSITEIIKSKNTDSLVLNLQSNKLYLYKDAEVNYVKNTLTADIMEIDIESNNIFAKGTIDTLENKYRKTVFRDQSIDYQVDSIVYNLKSEKGKIYGVYFEDSEGYVHGETIKKIDQTMNIKGGKYTTCDLEHPHFYLASTKAKYVTSKDSKQIIIGPSYLVIEDVPIPLPIPFGFFPIMTDRSSGIILPTVGEETNKGFFLRGGGWYQVINDYWDARLEGGIYTQGSWEANLQSTYAVRYKFKGNLSATYSNDKIGVEGDDDYSHMKNYSIKWTHTQDAKARPGTNFSASVNFASSGYNKYDGNMEDFVSTQTNSSISFSKTWQGTPFSFSSSLSQSQNNVDSTVVLSLPNFTFNMSNIYPFKRRNAMGAQKWYEKISLRYTGTFNNTINSREDALFSAEMFDNMKYGMKHNIPISTSFNLFGFINIAPSFNYNERWYFNKLDKEWNPETQQIDVDTVGGFYRVYDYSASVSASTILYGMYQFGSDSKVQAIRHMMTPTVSFSYSPNFGTDSYGYYDQVQVDDSGTIQQYSPYEQGIYGVPGNSASASLGFSLNNNIEMKVKSDSDSTGVKKVKILETLNLSSSYNFLADSFNLAPVRIVATTTLFKSLGVQMSANWDLYKYTAEGVRTNDFAWANGSAGRITNFNVSFGYSFRSIFGSSTTGTGSSSIPHASTEAPLQGSGLMGAPDTKQIQAINALNNSKYYDFSIPWNLSFSYKFELNNTGSTKDILQTLNLNGGVELTPKWALTMSTGIDLSTMKLTPGAISVIRDLHCWQMGFSWVPTGFRSSWSFNINVKSSALQDLKLKKSSSFYDNYYNTF